MNYCIKDLPKTERPRERLKEVGARNLTDKELLSIVLKTGMKEKNVNELSLELLKNYELKELKDISWNDLRKIKGIGEVKAIELVASKCYYDLGRNEILTYRFKTRTFLLPIF